MRGGMSTGTMTKASMIATAPDRDRAAWSIRTLTVTAAVGATAGEAGDTRAKKSWIKTIYAICSRPAIVRLRLR